MTTGYAFEPSRQHFYPDHPESPSRLDLLETRLPSLGAEPLDFEAASHAEVGLVHSPALIRSIQDVCALGSAVIDPAPTFVTRTSFDDALRAAGATLACLRAVSRGEVRNAFSIVRPPGHHAEPHQSMGFCIFNNIAIAARQAAAGGISRIAIIDHDAHHGNGTQAAVLNDERLAYLSTHQWGIYPGTGWYEEAEHARGRIVNVPLPAGAGDVAYDQIAVEVIEPFVRGFRPQLILVSAGFDAHWQDPLTSLGLSTAGFYSLSSRLVNLADEQCDGKILFVLEGGYDPANLANGVQAVFCALTGRRFSNPLDASQVDEPDVAPLLEAIKVLHGI